MQFEISLDYSILRKYNPEIELLAQLKESKQQRLTAIQHFISIPHTNEGEFEKFQKIHADLLEQYGLEQHKEHLLFFAGTLFQSFENAHVQKEDFKLAHESLKKVVALLKIHEQNSPNQISLTIKGPRVKEEVIIDKAILIQGVMQPLIQGLTTRISSPAFNTELYELLKDVQPTYTSYKEVLDTIKRSRHSEYIKTLTNFTSTIVDYLNNETSFKTPEGKLISNDQGRFLYQFFQLFGFVNDDKLSSDQEDYIRSLLTNQKNSIS